MRAILRDVVTLVRRLPDELTLGLNRWLLRAHEPESLDGEAWCLSFAHKKPEPWPCAEFLAADDRINDVLDRR